MRRIRKILTILLSILLIISCTIYVMAEPPDNGKQYGKDKNGDTEIENPIGEIEEPENETEQEDSSKGKGKNNSNITINITKVETSEDVFYSWDLNADFKTEEPMNNTTIFSLNAKRNMVSDELTLSVEAEVNQETILDIIQVELGDKIDDVFEPVRTYEISQVTQEVIEGATKIEFNLVVDLLDLDETELALLQKVRLSIPVDRDKGDNKVTYITDTHGFLLPETPTIINKEAKIETNLLDALVDIGTTDILVDDWVITEEDLDENNVFEREIEILLGNHQDAKDLVVLVDLKGDDDVLLKTVEVKFTGGEDGLSRNIWTGDVHHVHGFWLPPITDNFILERNSIQIKFWLAEPPSESLSIHIYEGIVDGEDNVTMGDLVVEVNEEELRTRKMGNKCRTWGQNIEGAYYKYNLKARNLESLVEGETYVFAVMYGDELLVFDDDVPATLTFKVSDNLLDSMKRSKSELNQNSRRNGINRN